MSASAGEVVIATVSAAFGHKNREEITMPRYHFVVRAPDHTHDDPDGTHFPNHDTAREHGHRIVRELADGGYKPGDAVLLVQDETRQTVHSITF